MKTSNETAAAAGAGAGGLAAMASALDSAGVEVSPARRATGAECQSIGQLLRGCERPAGPLLQAIQAQLDLSLCESFAHKLNKKMLGDGRESCLVRDASGAFGWVASMEDAIAAAAAAVACWRAGVSVSRDESGGECLTIGDEFGNVCGVWVKVISGDGVACKFKFNLGRVAWRALVNSIKADNLGESIAAQVAAKDYYDWAQADTNLGDMSRHIFEGLTVEQRQARRLAKVESVFEKLAAGRGRRKALAAKGKHATLLMLNGTAGDIACAAAGFKASNSSGGSGGKSSISRMASAMRRAGVRVVAKRGNFAERQSGDEFQAAARRGGAAKDLAELFTFPLRRFYPWRTFTRNPRRVVGAGVVLVSPSATSATSARVTGLHPLAKAVSGQGAAAAASVELSTLPASRVQLRRALAAANRRKLQGVLRSKVASVAAVTDDRQAAAHVAALVAADERGQAYVASIAAAKVAAAAKESAAAAVISSAALSSSVELRRVWVSGFGQTYEGASVAGWFPFRAWWRGASFVGFVRVADFRV